MTATPSQPLAPGAPSQPRRGALSQPQRLQLSGLIDDRIRGVTAREHQRAWLVTTVVLAQALITLMVVPGYLLPSANLPMLLTLGAALAFYLAAFIFNRLRGELRVAVYMLIGGGVLATAAQVFVTAALSKSGAHTAQAALLFLPLILEAGLFLTPELTLLVASAAAVLTASAIFLALALTNDSNLLVSDAYLVMVYGLGLEAFIGYLAWRLAQFIYETVKSSQADEDLRFTQALLGASQRQMNDQRNQLTQDVGVIQMAVSSALAHEYDTRIDVPDGDLAPLASSLNMLIQQLRSTNDLERKVQKMEAQAVPLVEMAGRLASGAAPASAPETSSDSALFSVRAALNQAQAMNARRQARLQDVATEIANSLKHSREGFVATAQEASKAQQIAGRLVALAETLTLTAQRQADLLAQARRALALVLPPELTQSDTADGSLREPPGRAEATGDLAGLGADIGIMSRYTGEFPLLDPVDQAAAGISPLTTPLPALSALAANADASEATSEDATLAAAGSDLPAGLADAWLLLSLLQAQTIAEARSVATFAYDIGVLGRHVRHTSAGIDWVHQAMEVVELSADRMQQLASPSGALADLSDDASAAGMAGGVARPGSTTVPRRAPLATHPLESGARLAADLEGTPPPPFDAAQQSAAAPGSLSVSDLIGRDTLGGQSDPRDGAGPQRG